MEDFLKECFGPIREIIPAEEQNVPGRSQRHQDISPMVFVDRSVCEDEVKSCVEQRPVRLLKI